MPPIGLLLGKVDFTNMFISLTGEKFATLAAAQEAGVPTMNVGLFVNTIVDFLIVAFVIFLVVRQLKPKEKPAPESEPTTKDCPFCFTSIPLKATRCPHCTSQLES